MLITGSSEAVIHDTKKVLHKKIKVKDLGELNFFLGIDILRSKDYDECTGNKDDALLVHITGYQRIIGKLLYLTTTRPDISVIVQILSEFM